MRAKRKQAVYTIEELAAQAENLFQTGEILVRAALITAGKTQYTEKEAAQVVASFRKKEVK